MSFTDDAGNEETLTSEATAAVVARPNTLATGAPSISGAAQVGRTLTANTSGISDADGLTNATFSYQWMANDGNTDTDIADATDSAYELSDDDVGTTVKVRVSFTDDAGNEGDADQRGDGGGGGTPQHIGHGRTLHQRRGAGGPDVDRKHVWNLRCRRADQCHVQLPVDGQ